MGDGRVLIYVPGGLVDRYAYLSYALRRLGYVVEVRESSGGFRIVYYDRVWSDPDSALRELARLRVETL